MTPIRVVDASVVAAWVLPDEYSATAVSLVRCDPGESLAAPSHYPAEIANVVLSAERRRRLTAGQARRAQSAIIALPMNIDERGHETVWNVAYPLAQEHGLTLYDALYLELALRLNLPLATFDVDLRRAAEAEGVFLV